MKILFPLIAAVAMFVAAPVHAAIYSVNDAFAANESGAPTNPNGLYSYGYTENPTDVTSFKFDAYIHTDSWAGNSDLQGYFVPNTEIVPAIVQNTSTSTTTTSFGVDVEAGQILMHAGGIGSSAYTAPIMSAVIRYTAAISSNYNISGLFSQLHTGISEVGVYINGVQAFTSPSAGGGSFNLNQYVAAGQYIDIVVGPGADGIGANSTGLFADIHATPEPATLAIWGGIGLCSMVAGYRRRRNQK